MKLPPFDHTHKEWDRFKHFHVNHFGAYRGLFTQFETGDVTVNYARLKPRERCVYAAFGLALTYTKDANFKFATPEGEPVPTAWLTQGGSQALVVDLDKKKAWKLVREYGDKLRAAPVPAYAKNAAIYFPNIAADPVTFGNIKLVRPDKEFANSAKEWIQAVRAAAMAVMRIRGLAAPAYNCDVRVDLYDADIAKSPEDYIAGADPQTVRYIAYNGFKLRRTAVEVPYLLVR